uniref:Uncharacterized protein n=1 Tax=Anopheles albimanus TaxID=7167 RepID=A0A182FZ45_ANOAL
MVQVWLLALVL